MNIRFFSKSAFLHAVLLETSPFLAIRLGGSTLFDDADPFPECPDLAVPFTELRLLVDDINNDDTTWAAHAKQNGRLFDQTHATLIKDVVEAYRKEDGTSILVHCAQGLSRSVAVVAALQVVYKQNGFLLQSSTINWTICREVLKCYNIPMVDNTWPPIEANRLRSTPAFRYRVQQSSDRCIHCGRATIITVWEGKVPECYLDELGQHYDQKRWFEVCCERDQWIMLSQDPRNLWH